MRRIRRLWMTFVLFAVVYILVINVEYTGKQRYRFDEDATLKEVEDISKLNHSEPVEILSNASIAVILAYLRSGSSFTGAGLQAVPKTFYLFEPIRSLVEQFRTAPDTDVPILYPNGTTILYNKEEEHDVMMREIENGLTCSFGNLSAASLSDSFYRTRTTLMNKLLECTLLYGKVHHKRSRLPLFTLGIDYPLFSLDNWTRCLEEVRHDCLTAPVRLVKFIRIPMSDMKPLMLKFPNMKILHLHRDPRAMYNSRFLNNRFKLVDFGTQFCARWIQDIKIAKDLSKEFPGRISTVRYEDIAENPHKMFKYITNFFGMDFDPGINNFLINITNVTQDGGPMTIQRVDPYQTASHWRNEMKLADVEYIGKMCATGMREMTYLPFSNEKDMKNLDLPFRGQLNNLDGNSIT